MISHYNVIANILQSATYGSVWREKTKKTEVTLGLLPFSHIYGLVVIASLRTYQGDGVIVLPKFDLKTYLKAIETYKINILTIVSYAAL